MKNIILCEGRHDSIFFDELLKFKANETYFVEKNNIEKKGGEGKIIGDFLTHVFYSNKFYLIKDEGGKPEVKYYFRKFFRLFGWYRHQLLIIGIIDADRENRINIFDEFRDFIRENNLDIQESVGKYSIVFTSSENRKHILFVVPETLEKEAEKVFGIHNPENIRKLTKENIDWINELKGIICQ